MQLQLEECSYKHDSTLSKGQNTLNEINAISKTKITMNSLWNVVKYEFHNKFTAKFSFDSPICLLGQFYHIKMSESVDLTDKKSCCLYAYEKLKQDFYSRIWFTYRKDFPPILNTNFTTDVGWGCMIRSGQMILAQALLSHFLCRNWRWKGSISDKEDMIHRMIIKWFADNPNASISPFSIHELSRIGLNYSKKPGDWFGPASVSLIIKSALMQASQSNKILQNIVCYVAQDCTVYLQDLIDLCTNSSKTGKQSLNDPKCNWNSIIILIPVRLGGERFNTEYTMYLKEILSMPYTLGVIGGKPRHSLYFVGFQDEKLLHIDPHYCQRTVDVSQPDFSLESFHCTSPRKISFSSIDPSSTIGFYLKTKDEFEEFTKFAHQQMDHATRTGSYPIFSLHSRRDEQYDPQEDESRSDRIIQMQYKVLDSRGNLQQIIKADEFVLL